MINLQSGDTIWVRAFKADGTCYRWREVVVEEVDKNSLITFHTIDNQAFRIGGEWTQVQAFREHYWFDRPYNLYEVFGSNGELVELYANVANLPQLVNGELHFTDYELDVSYPTGKTPEIVDQDEFAEAVVKFGYSPEFQQQCYAIAAEALDLVGRWQVRSKQSAVDSKQ